MNKKRHFVSEWLLLITVFALLAYLGSSVGREFLRWVGGPMPVAIDIKPRETPNSINPGSKGKIPVAILSSRTFNAVERIDSTSLTFGHMGDENSLAFCHTEDVNVDGLSDLVCHFNTLSTGFIRGDTLGSLNGKTIDGILVGGTDSVSIVPD
jgi:hypothetical protein